MSLAIVVVTCARAQADPAAPVETLPGDIEWARNPAIPPGGEIAVLKGKPGGAGLYAFRLKFPADHKVMPHTHPEERTYTVVAGTWHIGLGDEFEPAKLKAFPAGSFYVLPANLPHFHWAKAGESIVQVVGAGPTATHYVDPSDDPRKR